MMQLKFINLCDHLLCLLLVSSALFFIIFIQSVSYAEIVNGLVCHIGMIEHQSKKHVVML